MLVELGECQPCSFSQNAAEIEVHPNGKWMYFSNRIGAGAIVTFEVLEDGNLNFVQVF